MNVDYTIKKSPDFIFDYLTDMQKFVSVHPVIYKIDTLGGNKYLVFEQLKIGFIPYSFTYVVTIESNLNNKTITMNAIVMNMVKIKMEYRIESINEYSIVHEAIQFKTWLPVKSFMNQIFKAQHKQLFLNIERAT